MRTAEIQLSACKAGHVCPWPHAWLRARSKNKSDPRRQITALSPEEMLGIKREKRIAYRFFMVRARGAYAVGCTPARPKSKNKSKHYSRLSRLSLLLLGWRVGLLLTCLFYPNLAHTVAERYSCVDRVFPWMPQPRKPNC